MPKNEIEKPDTKTSLLARAILEMIFIIFLFYANLLMGEFTRSGASRHRSLVWAVHNIFTLENFIIAVIAAFIGSFVFEAFRKRL